MKTNRFLGLVTVLVVSSVSPSLAGDFKVELHQGSGGVIPLGELKSFNQSSLTAEDAYNYSVVQPRYNGIVSTQPGTNVFLSDTLNGLALYMVNQTFPSSIGQLKYQVTTEGSLLFRDDIVTVDNDLLLTTSNGDGTTTFVSYEGFTGQNTDGLVLGLTDTNGDGRMVSWNYEDVNDLNFPLLNIPRINFWSPDGTQNISIELGTDFNPETDSIVLKEVVLEVPETSTNLGLLGFTLATLALSWKGFRHR